MHSSLPVHPIRCDPFAGFCGGISMTSSDAAQLTLAAEAKKWRLSRSKVLKVPNGWCMELVGCWLTGHWFWGTASLSNSMMVVKFKWKPLADSSNACPVVDSGEFTWTHLGYQVAVHGLAGASSTQVMIITFSASCYLWFPFQFQRSTKGRA